MSLRNTKEYARFMIIIKFKEVLGNYICEKLLFVHSFTGCDTTSAFYGIGKWAALKYFIKSDDFQNIVSVFMNRNATQSQVKNSGEGAVMILYHSNEPTIYSTREKMLSSKVLKAKSFVKPELLPPTSSAVKFHNNRSYYQIMKWLSFENNIDATDCV